MPPQVADDAVINICRIMLNSRKLGCPSTINNYKRVAKNDREWDPISQVCLSASGEPIWPGDESCELWRRAVHVQGG